MFDDSCRGRDGEKIYYLLEECKTATVGELATSIGRGIGYVISILREHSGAFALTPTGTRRKSDWRVERYDDQ